MERALIGFIVFAVCLQSFVAFASDKAGELPKAAAYILIEASSGQVLSEFNADEHMPPASLTKIMLLLIAAEEINAGRLALSDNVTASSYASSADSSVIWLEPGEVMSVDDLIKSVVIASANDAAIALAEHIAGSEDEFVKMMNQKAYVLGMTGTNFTNVVGYDKDKHYTTARDVSIMSAALMREENYALYADYMLTRLTSVRTGTDRETQLLNTNKLITWYNGIEGIKTGTTDKAGYCLSAAATRGGMRLIGVVMGCESEEARVDLSEILLDYGFANYEVDSEADSKLPSFSDVEVVNGVQRKVGLIPDKPGSVVIPKGRAGDVMFDVYIPGKVTAPIKAGQPIGTIVARLDRTVLYEGYVKAEYGVEKVTFLKVLGYLFRCF